MLTIEQRAEALGLTRSEFAGCLELTRDFRGLPLTIPVAACQAGGLPAACEAAEAWAEREAQMAEEEAAAAEWQREQAQTLWAERGGYAAGLCRPC